MATMDNYTPRKQLITLALPGLIILVLFAAGLLWLYQMVLGNGEGGVFLAFAPYWVYPYLVVVSAYTGFFAA